MSKISEAVIESARAMPIADVIGRYISLKKTGSEYSALCPFHQEKTPSFSVNTNKNFYHCFGCGAAGSPIDFVMSYESVDFRTAVEKIVGNLPPDFNAAKVRESYKQAEQAEWEAVIPVPEDAPAAPTSKYLVAPNKNVTIPPDHHTFTGGGGDLLVRHEATARYAYYTADGLLAGYVSRYDCAWGGKEVIPQTYCRNSETGSMQWKWQAFPKPRPIYGLDRLAAHPKAQVLIVEGEKACAAARQIFLGYGISEDKLVVVSWAGGGKAVKHTDWSPLAGRSIALWPDADQQNYPDRHPKVGERVPLILQPGTACMLDIATHLQGAAASIKIVTPPSGVPDGWDLADPAPEGFDVRIHIKTSSLPVDDFRDMFASEPAESPELPPDAKPLAAAELPWEGPAVESKPVLDEPESEPEEFIQNGHFTILGYDGDEYYFFHHDKKQVMARRSNQFTDIGLIELAPINWWEEFFPSDSGINRKAAVNWIFRTANERGIYDPSRVRGRGAWVDDGRLVYHHGQYLTVDGKPAELTNIRSAYVYPQSRSMRAPDPVPMADEEGRRLLEIAKMARWSKPASAALICGWVMLAPICGALSWRPHIWLTGGAGTGKTTLQKLFCGSLTRGVHLYANGDSTEAGIRQALRGDALPVLIDEFESNNEREKQRTEALIAMIRKNSSETQAKTFKGTISGESMQFDIRSMFCLASINTNLPTKADEDRLSILTLRPNGDDNWQKLKAALDNIDLDKTISSRLLARSLSMMPILLEAVGIFRRLGGKFFERQRDGDQYGTLLAGCWCLCYSRVPSEKEALDMIGAFDWSEHMEDHDQDDAERALEALMSAKLKVPHGAELSVFELIRECSPVHRMNVLGADVADATLKRHGIRVQGDELWFGTGITPLKGLVEKMAFVTDLRGQLLRIKGAKRMANPQKFNGINSKVVSVPLGPILASEDLQNGMPI